MLGGCGGLQLDSRPLGEVNLSGTWVVDANASDDVGASMLPDVRRSDRNRRMSTKGEIQRIRRGSGLAFVAQDIQVLDAVRMVIELTDDSMGIQHFPGVYRDVSWGRKERGIWQIQAGWDEDVLVIASNTNGIDVTERYQLLEPNHLLVSLDVRADGNHRSINKSFRRFR